MNNFPFLLKTTIFTLCTILYFAMCSAQTDTKELSIPVVKKAEVKNMSLKAGLYDCALEMTNGKKWDVRILVPEIQKDKKYPMVLAMHWAGDQEAFKTYSDCLLFPAFEGIDAIIVIPSADNIHWIHPNNEKRVIDLVRQLKKQFPIAKQQILVTGYSNGGIGSWKYAHTYPKLFCAAIPVAGYYEKRKIHIPVYAIHGEKDELFTVHSVQNALDQSKLMGSQLDLTIAKNLSHYMACSYVELLREKARLIESLFFN